MLLVSPIGDGGFITRPTIYTDTQPHVHCGGIQRENRGLGRHGHGVQPTSLLPVPSTRAGDAGVNPFGADVPRLKRQRKLLHVPVSLYQASTVGGRAYSSTSITFVVHF